MVKNLGLTMILALVLSGMGHIYLGFVKRGIIILIVGLVSSIVASILIPFPYNWIVIIGYWIWQMWDAYNHYKKLKPRAPQTGI